MTPEPTSPGHGPQTLLALANFPSHGRRFSDVPEFVRAYAQVKAAAATANVALGVLDAERGDAITAAAREVADGRHADRFPTALVQGGGGTSTNMNVNEVLAARATELLAGSGVVVHPNDHVNRSQSTNDTYPTAMALALRALTAPAVAALGVLERSLLAKADEYGPLPRLGRTCLQDAVPLPVDATHRAQAAAVRRAAGGLRDAAAALTAVPLGATAVGTGIGAPDGYAAAAVSELAALAGVEVAVADDFFDALAHLDPYSALAAAAARAATTMGKIAADLRLLSSGPAGGLGEVVLPARQAGSSIMPGKVNPVIPELVIQLGFRVRGAAATVDLAVAAGELELNVMEPVVLDALVTALADVTAAAGTFATACVDGLRWDTAAVAGHLRGSLHEFVELAGDAGYDAARLARSRTPVPHRQERS